jgi:hypothetical protein
MPLNVLNDLTEANEFEIMFVDSGDVDSGDVDSGDVDSGDVDSGDSFIKTTI